MRRKRSIKSKTNSKNDGETLNVVFLADEIERLEKYCKKAFTLCNANPAMSKVRFRERQKKMPLSGYFK